MPLSGHYHRYRSPIVRWLTIFIGEVDASSQTTRVSEFIDGLLAKGAELVTQAYRLTGDKDHAGTARRTLDYVLREMRSENGLFYSATDADSDGGEGRYFTWTPAELVDVLGNKRLH